MGKKATSGIMLILLMLSVLTLAFNIQLVEAEPRTWTVDDDGPADFHTIQEAINAASPGDTIFVHNGTYYELLYVNKDDLTIVGENKSNTIIDGERIRAVIRIPADNVAVCGFTVRRSSLRPEYSWGSAIYLYGESCNISGNMVSDSRYGITLVYTGSNSVTGNTISDAEKGIVLAYSNDNTVVGNAISNIYGIIVPEAARGIELWSSCNNTIIGNAISNIGNIGIFLSHYSNTVFDNTVTNSTTGVYLMEGSHDNIIEGNTISNSTPGWASYGMNIYGFNNMIIGNRITNISYTGIRLNSYAPYPIKCTNNVVSGNNVSKTNQGIAAGFEAPSNTIKGNNASDNYIGLFIFDHSDNNTFINNVVSNNYYGIALFSSNDTEVCHNNFIDNTEQILLADSFGTTWDDGYPSGGNYWSNHVKVDLYSGEFQDQLGGDGIVDMPYVIDGSNRDNYPHMSPWTHAITAIVEFEPNALNLKSRSKWITVYIELPEGHNASYINVFTILLGDTVPAVTDPKYDFVTNSSEYLTDLDGDGLLERMVKFDKATVTEYVTDVLRMKYGNLTLTITGQVAGTSFNGSCTIKVLLPGDVDGDGDVDWADFGDFALAYGSKGPPQVVVPDATYNPQADFDLDGDADWVDFGILAEYYGKTAL